MLTDGWQTWKLKPLVASCWQRRLIIALKWTPDCSRMLHVDSKWKTLVSTSMLLHELSRNKLYKQQCRQRRKQGGLSDWGMGLEARPRQVFYFTLKTAFWLAVYAESRPTSPKEVNKIFSPSFCANLTRGHRRQLGVWTPPWVRHWLYKH